MREKERKKGKAEIGTRERMSTIILHKSDDL